LYRKLVGTARPRGLVVLSSLYVFWTLEASLCDGTSGTCCRW